MQNITHQAEIINKLDPETEVVVEFEYRRRGWCNNDTVTRRLQLRQVAQEQKEFWGQFDPHDIMYANGTLYLP